MNVLKFTTAGSVDDGKSTLIGRFLYDTKSLTTDQIEAIERASKRKGLSEIDLSLATDGLIAEREQGITIDVAHIYFSTPKRKFIIADTPGHVEYTRNMITGASSSKAALILIDARNGMLEQTKRHLYITNLLRIKEVIICINKMDLVDYNQQVYNKIVDDVKNYANGLYHSDFNLHFFPISARLGDNVVTSSKNMPWFTDKPLLPFMEELNIEENQALPARFAVQYVIRVDNEKIRDYRAFAGKVKSGVFQIGDEVLVLPTNRTSKIIGIERFTEKLNKAVAGESVAILLADDIDVSRGSIITKINDTPQALKSFRATICWLSTEPANLATRYILQHGIARTPSKIDSVLSILDPNTLSEIKEKQIVLNEIAEVNIRTANAIYADNYENNPANGAFILIDPQTNNTVAVGFVRL